MAFSEKETNEIETAMGAFMDKRRPPVTIRTKVDLGYRIAGHSIELFEIRPRWRKPEEMAEHSFAKATYVRTHNIWKVFWMRADLKWHRYDPVPDVKRINEFLTIVDHDECGCFFG